MGRQRHVCGCLQVRLVAVINLPESTDTTGTVLGRLRTLLPLTSFLVLPGLLPLWARPGLFRSPFLGMPGADRSCVVCEGMVMGMGSSEPVPQRSVTPADPKLSAFQEGHYEDAFSDHF